MKRLLILASLAALGACETTADGGGIGGGSVGDRIVWHCDHGAAFSVRFASNGAQVAAGGQTYDLPHVRGAVGARYANGSVEYWERAGLATLTGAHGGPYANCHRR